MMNLINYYGNNTNFNPCMCCGMTYSPGPTKQNTSDNGIHVVYGKQGKEMVKKDSKNKKQTNIKHVKTRNGDLTVITRSAYVAG